MAAIAVIGLMGKLSNRMAACASNGYGVQLDLVGAARHVLEGGQQVRWHVGGCSLSASASRTGDVMVELSPAQTQPPNLALALSIPERDDESIGEAKKGDSLGLEENGTIFKHRKCSMAITSFSTTLRDPLTQVG
ncbi:MAG: hypothetical protein Q9169_006173 [Polycauliona sp. 2 TL-2023]